MAFISIVLASLLNLILCIVTIIGVLILVIGILFLVVYLIRRKKKAGKGFLIAAIIMLCVSIPMSSILPVLSIVSSSSSASKTITIENTVYRNGFCEDLYPLYIDYQDDYYSVDGQNFHRVNGEQFDLMYTPSDSAAFDALYCSEEQWEQAKAYYSDSDNFVYYCGNVVNSDVDISKFEALMEFAEENEYNPFGSNSDVKTCRLPMPDLSSALLFYKESKDGIVTSSKRHKFHLIDGKLFMVFYYDMGHGKYEELVAVEVPEEIGQYFVEFLESQK